MWRDCRKWHRKKQLKSVWRDSGRWICFNASWNNVSKVKRVLNSNENKLREVIQKPYRNHFCLHYQCWLGNNYTPLLMEGDWSGRRTSRFFCSLAELPRMKLKLFSSPIWRGAVLIERLNFQSSRRYAHKHARMQNAKWGRGTKQSPRQAQGHRKYRQKGEAGIMWGLEQIVVAIHQLLYGKETIIYPPRAITDVYRCSSWAVMWFNPTVAWWRRSWGGVRSGIALISKTCAVLFIQCASSCSPCPAFHPTAHGESFQFRAVGTQTGG